MQGAQSIEVLDCMIGTEVSDVSQYQGQATWPKLDLGHMDPFGGNYKALPQEGRKVRFIDAIGIKRCYMGHRHLQTQHSREIDTV